MPINGNRLKLRTAYTHEQDTPSDTWTVNHNLSRSVIHDVAIDYDGQLEKVLPLGVTHPDNNTLVIQFSQPFTGTVRVN